MGQDRRLAAILFADICGYSRIMDENEARALSVVETANTLVDRAVSLYGGRVIKKLGDGVLCEFPSAVNAVRAAIEIQKSVSDHNKKTRPEYQFQLRIGIHVGDVVVANGDILGDGVNVASRIQPLAEAGGICVSRDVFDLVKNKVAIEAVNLGPHDLKNISRQVDIYKIIIDAVGSGITPPSIQPQRSAEVKRYGKMPAWGWMAIVAAVLVLFVLGSRIAKTRKIDREARLAAETVLADADRLEKQGDAAGALKALSAFPDRYRWSRWYSKIQETANRLQEPAARCQIQRRQFALFKALQENRRHDVAALLHPDTVRQTDPLALGIKLRVAELLAKGIEVDKDHIRVERIDFNEDKTCATVWVRVLRKTPESSEDKWIESAPFVWVREGNEWFLRLEPLKPGPHQRVTRRPLKR